MPLCETIVTLIDLVMENTRPVTHEDMEWASAIRSIVEFRDQQRLDEWEACVNRVAPSHRETPPRELLGEIEMLAMCNLYQAFDSHRTNAFYDRLRPCFSQRGIELPIAPDLTAW